MTECSKRRNVRWSYNWTFDAFLNLIFLNEAPLKSYNIPIIVLNRYINHVIGFCEQGRIFFYALSKDGIYLSKITFRVVTYFTLSLAWIAASSAPAQINIHPIILCGGMVAYQLDFNRRLTVFFEDRTSVWVRLDPRRWSRRRCPISASVLIARGVDTMWEWCLSSAHSLFSEFSGETPGLCDRGPSTTIVCRVRFFVSPEIRFLGWFITQRDRGCRRG